LWLGALWSIFVLAVADEIMRPLIGGGIICALSFWQLAYRRASKRKVSTTLPDQLSGSPSLAKGGIAPASAESASTPMAATEAIHYKPVRLRDVLLLLLSMAFTVLLAVLRTTDTQNLAERAGHVTGWVLAGLLFWIPGYFIRARKGDWRGFLNWCAGATLIAAVLALNGSAQRAVTRPQILFRQLKHGEISPYQFVRASRAADPAGFDKGLLGSLEKSTRATSPEMELTRFRLISVTDRGTNMGVEVSYAGSYGEPGTPAQPLEGQARMFYHSSGVVSLEGVCFSSDANCERMVGLLSSAESTLAAHISDSDLSGVMPAGGECKTESTPLPNSDHNSDVLICQYAPRIALTLSRRNQSDVVKAIEAGTAQDPELKRLFGT
jgi:hypothetical protein